MAEAWSGVPVKLNKKSMLKSKIGIALLFEEGVSFYKPPLLIKYRGCGGAADCRYMVSVSKRRFPRAVDRNRVKRLMREVIRKGGVVEPWPQDIALIFIGKGTPQFKHIWRSWIGFLEAWEAKSSKEIPLGSKNDDSEHPA